MLKVSFELVLVLALTVLGILIAATLMIGHAIIWLIILGVGYTIYRHNHPKQIVTKCPDCELKTMTTECPTCKK